MTDNEDLGETISDANEWEVPKTAENDEGREATSRGNDWEVVSLTASAYAAAPGPRGDESIHEASDSTFNDNDATETSQALFLSGHFVFPPSQHENLPIVPEKLENPKGAKEADLVSEVGQLKDGKHENIDENWGIEGLNVKELSTFGQEYDEPIGRLELNVDEKEQDVYGATKLRSLHNAAVISAVDNLVEASNNVIDPSYLASHAPKSVKKDEDDDSELPCGAWWKRGVASLCAHAKETRSFWSIVVAAAVMGLVVLGQRWQQEKRQILHQNWQLTVGDEKSVRILSRLKDVIIGGSRHTNYVTAASAEL